MRIDLAIRGALEFGEAVDVELPDEGGKVMVLIVFGEDFERESVQLYNGEGFGGDPLNAAFAVWILNYQQGYVENR